MNRDFEIPMEPKVCRRIVKMSSVMNIDVLPEIVALAKEDLVDFSGTKYTKAERAVIQEIIDLDFDLMMDNSVACFKLLLDAADMKGNRVVYTTARSNDITRFFSDRIEIVGKTTTDHYTTSIVVENGQVQFVFPSVRIISAKNITTTQLKEYAKGELLDKQESIPDEELFLGKSHQALKFLCSVVEL